MCVFPAHWAQSTDHRDPRTQVWGTHRLGPVLWGEWGGGGCLVSCAASNGRSYHRPAHRPYLTWPLSAPHWIIPHGGPAHLQSSPLSRGPISASAPLSAMKKRRKGARWREPRRRDGGRGYFMLLRGNGSQQRRQLPITPPPLCWTGSSRWSDHRN